MTKCDWKIVRVGMFGVATLLASASAVEYVGSGNWSDGNWDPAEPGVANDAFIRTGTQNVTITRPGEVAHRLVVGQSGSHSTLNVLGGSLDLVGGGSQSSAGQLYVCWSGDGETSGVVNLSGGLLSALGYYTMTNSAGDRAQLNISGNAVLDLDGGLKVGHGHADTEDRVAIIGSGARIDIQNNAHFGPSSTLRFSMDASGVSALHANSLTVAPGAQLVIDFGTYVYSGAGTDVIQLVHANVFVGAFNEANVRYLNDAGMDHELIQDPDDSQGVYVRIPEPGTCAWLMGLLAWATVMWRRRRA